MRPGPRAGISTAGQPNFRLSPVVNETLYGWAWSLSTADEIASLALYLCQQRKRIPTDMAHIIDGGWTL